MYLREVIANGFKSFADRTRIEMGPGVTTVVGPNGCGKSNIVDAIRWVLGEQSAKALRGAKMHDVIFAGTDTRAPLNQCEVTLIFADCEDALGTAFNEVEITRRVNREGSSNYYLNGKVCRLKDIQQLFMDTGIGRVSYSFMVQGQIDQILSNNPAERRVIFEEAAGITRYKAQRREALGKLALVDQNLTRIVDVIDEVGRQMSALKRQASKALRYKRVNHRLTHLDLALNSHKYSVLKVTLVELREKAEALRVKVLTLQGDLETDESSLEGKKVERTELYGRLQEIQKESYELRSKKDQAENQAELCLMRAKDAETRVTQIRGELDSLLNQIKELDEKAKDDSHIKQMQLNLVDSSDQVCKEKQDEVQKVQNELSVQEALIQEKRRALSQAEGGMHRLRTKLTDWEVRLKTDEAKLLDLEQNQKENQESQGDLQKRLGQSQDELTQQGSFYAEFQKSLEEVQSKAHTSREAFRDTQKLMQDQDRQLARLQAQLSILEGLQEKLEGFSDGAKAILKGKLGEGLDLSNVSVLSKGIEVTKGYGTMLERLMGQASDAVSVEGWDHVRDITKALAERNLGRACLQVPVSGAKNLWKYTKTLPEGLTKAVSVISSKDKTILANWERLLGGCYFAEDLDQFIEFWEANADFNFLFVATQEGALIDGRGLVYAGSSAKKKGGDSNFIEREAEIKALKDSVQEEKAKLDALNEQVKAVQEALEKSEHAVEEQRRNLADANQKLSSARIEVREAENALKRNADNLERTNSQVQRIKQTHDEALAAKASVESESKLEIDRVESLREELARAEQGVVQKREERDSLREALSEIRIDLAEKKQRLSLLDQGLSEVEQRKAQIAQTHEFRLKEIDRLDDQSKKLIQDSEVAKVQAEEFDKAHIERVAALDIQKKALIAVEETITKAEADLAGRRKLLHTEEDQLKSCELKLTQEEAQSVFLLEKVSGEYHLELEEIDWKAEFWKADEEFETKLNLDDIDEGEELTHTVKHKRSDPSEDDLAAMDATNWREVEKEVNELRGKLSSMGAVNLVAIEEYVELRERHAFLTDQCADLTNSKEQLVVAIDEINTKSQEMFVQTFEKVRQNFKFTFDALFGGGHADLSLVENEDFLECGIDIIAQPPGTKMKGLSLLSGGQKTMTAVALLFAIYKVKPSPFCVLDELDAPLDDANIGRFTSMLREFTRYSQFLVISHNKRTISASDRLYGVTMQERGVTRLVSMKFKKDEKAELDTEAATSFAGALGV